MFQRRNAASPCLQPKAAPARASSRPVPWLAASQHLRPVTPSAKCVSPSAKYMHFLGHLEVHRVVWLVLAPSETAELITSATHSLTHRHTHVCVDSPLNKNFHIKNKCKARGQVLIPLAGEQITRDVTGSSFLPGQLTSWPLPSHQDCPFPEFLGNSRWT